MTENWLKNISRSGILAIDEYQERRGILLANYISLILCAALLLLFSIRRFIFGHIPGGIDVHLLVVGLFSFLIPITLNGIPLRSIGRLVLCYSSVFFMWYAYMHLMKQMSVIEQSSYDSLRIHLLAVSFVPYLVLDKKKPLVLIFGIIPTLISIILFDPILSQFDLGINQRGVPDTEFFLMDMRTFIAYFIISISCFIFQSIITYNDELNKKILAELKQKSELIISQNEELMQSQEHVNEINHHLEYLVLEKTKNIQKQNDVLLKYAYTNAHHVRGPVARLLGLVQISRLKTDLDYPWFFDKVENEAKEVDRIISSIAKDLNDIDQSEVSNP